MMMGPGGILENLIEKSRSMVTSKVESGALDSKSLGR